MPDTQDPILKDERGTVEATSWGEIQVTLPDGRWSFWKYPASQFVAEGSLTSGQSDPEGVAEQLAREAIAKLKGKPPERRG